MDIIKLIVETSNDLNALLFNIIGRMETHFGEKII